MNLKTLDQRVRLILDEYPELSKLIHKKRLVWYYWTKYDGLKEEMKFEDFLQLTDEESIVRSRRKVLEESRVKEVLALQQQHKYKNHYKKR